MFPTDCPLGSHSVIHMELLKTGFRQRRRKETAKRAANPRSERRAPRRSPRVLSGRRRKAGPRGKFLHKGPASARDGRIPEIRLRSGAFGHLNRVLGTRRPLAEGLNQPGPCARDFPSAPLAFSYSARVFFLAFSLSQRATRDGFGSPESGHGPSRFYHARSPHGGTGDAADTRFTPPPDFACVKRCLPYRCFPHRLTLRNEPGDRVKYGYACNGFRYGPADTRCVGNAYGETLPSILKRKLSEMETCVPARRPPTRVVRPRPIHHLLSMGFPNPRRFLST